MDVFNFILDCLLDEGPGRECNYTLSRLIPWIVGSIRDTCRPCNPSKASFLRCHLESIIACDSIFTLLGYLLPTTLKFNFTVDLTRRLSLSILTVFTLTSSLIKSKKGSNSSEHSVLIVSNFKWICSKNYKKQEYSSCV